MKSQLVASSTNTPPSSSPTLAPNGDRPQLAVRTQDGQTPNSVAPTLAHALKSLNEFDTGVASRDRALQPTYDSPYTRSIPSTAPGSPRMYVAG
ncbi:hypothetical protein GQ53DRAFT_749158 [Thozetella sp. PMI_491]|nr:hypothetical protein GQ53DRAFT_749158 [Thozetella sp. PMI_491]